MLVSLASRCSGTFIQYVARSLEWWGSTLSYTAKVQMLGLGVGGWGLVLLTSTARVCYDPPLTVIETALGMKIDR